MRRKTALALLAKHQGPFAGYLDNNQIQYRCIINHHLVNVVFWQVGSDRLRMEVGRVEVKDKTHQKTIYWGGDLRQALRVALRRRREFAVNLHGHRCLVGVDISHSGFGPDFGPDLSFTLCNTVVSTLQGHDDFRIAEGFLAGSDPNDALLLLDYLAERDGNVARLLDTLASSQPKPKKVRRMTRKTAMRALWIREDWPGTTTGDLYETTVNGHCLRVCFSGRSLGSVSAVNTKGEWCDFGTNLKNALRLTTQPMKTAAT